MVAIVQLQQSDIESLGAFKFLEGIVSNKEVYKTKESTIPLINDLEMRDVFKDEDKEEGAGVTDLIR